MHHAHICVRAHVIAALRSIQRKPGPPTKAHTFSLFSFSLASQRLASSLGERDVRGDGGARREATPQAARGGQTAARWLCPVEVGRGIIRT